MRAITFMLLFNLSGVFERKKAQTWLRGMKEDLTVCLPARYESCYYYFRS